MEDRDKFLLAMVMPVGVTIGALIHGMWGIFIGGLIFTVITLIAGYINLNS